MDSLKAFFGISSNDVYHARVIARAADESAQESRALNEQLKAYTQTDDPFKAMMIDLHNKRTAMQMARRGNDDC